MKVRAVSRFLIVCAGLALLGGLAGNALSAAPGKSLENLQAAFNGESNAHARYLAFAQKADEEGYPGTAALFRAAARAEAIHASNHAVVIKKMGAEPKAEIKEPEVKSTKENLEAAVQGETYERDTMYPEFIKVATAEKNKQALRTFNFAKSAEAEHAKLYAAYVKDMDSGKTATNYFVCSVCGYTRTDLNFKKCSVCFSPKDKYEKVV